MIRRSHILTTAALLAVCATPAYASSDYPVAPSPSSIAAGETRGYQDLRSPDTRDAAAQSVQSRSSQEPYVLNRDYGSPDAVDAARDLPPVQVPVVAADGTPSGFDWGDAGIGAGGMFALFSIAGGAALLLTGRKRRHGLA